MLDVVSIGSSLIDIFVHSSEFSLQQSNQGVLLCQILGDKIEVDDFNLRTGGGGSNTSVGFARMGFDAGVITETGKDAWSQIIIEEYHKEYVSTGMVVEERKEQTGGSIILVSKDGSRTVLVHRGAASMLDPHDIPTEKLGHIPWVHLSSIAGVKSTIKTIFEAVGEGSGKLSWNPGNAELELLASGEIPVNELPVEILFVNKEEWQVLADRQNELVSRIPQILVTNGDKGGELLLNGESQPYSALRSESVDDTGAGDAFAVGYVSAVLYGKDPQTAIRWGTRNAQSVIKQVGAKPGLLRKNHMEIE